MKAGELAKIREGRQPVIEFNEGTKNSLPEVLFFFH